MKATARSLLSATTALGLTAFTVITAFTGVSVSVPATSFGLLAVYGIVEMMIHSYAPRRAVVRSAAVRVVAPHAATVRVPALVEFPACSSRACAA